MNYNDNEYKTSHSYVGATENFKSRYRNHIKSFKNKIYSNETVLSKHIWELKDANKNFDINWKIIKVTSGFSKNSNNCSLCLSEKYAICKFKMKNNLLNKRSELINKCRHENKFLLKYHH